jgi:A/G-specific adenine glycosylase
MKSARSQAGNPEFGLPAASLATLLVDWYHDNRRDLPWRLSRDPYRIWISEIMLQQTTVAAVLPYYEKFMKTFPDVHALAKAPLEKVLEMWSGLGYYSRARNLHKAAGILAGSGFPRTAAELQELPGLGPYTSRAISSLAFGEKVGVLDGNVIRILSRVAGARVEHWKPAGRDVLQAWADELAAHADPSDLNQGMMELGATVCTPQSPVCLLCPWKKHCVSRKEGLINELPLKKPRKDFEIWYWRPQIMIDGDRVALVQNAELPFLKGQWVFPGPIERLKKRPEKFDLRHGITHHDIYIRVQKSPRAAASKKDVKWCSLRELSSVNPSILLQKVLSKASD